MYWIGSVFAFLIPVVIIGAVVYLIVHRRGEGNGFSAYHGLITYFYFVISASIITITIGIGLLLYVGFHQAYGGGSVDDIMVLGLTLAGTGAVICILHVFGKLAAEKKEIRGIGSIRRVYLFFMLAIYSMTGLVAVPLAIYAFAHYYVEGSRHWGDPSAPLATAIVVVPLWIYYLMRVMRETRATKEAS
jgi:hypothetical protein